MANVSNHIYLQILCDISHIIISYYYIYNDLDPRTSTLIDGFTKELEGRMKAFKDAREDLEKQFAKRIDDALVDAPEHAQYKQDSLQACRNAEAACTSFAGSVRTIKNVLEPLLNESVDHGGSSRDIYIYIFKLITVLGDINLTNSMIRA